MFTVLTVLRSNCASRGIEDSELVEQFSEEVKKLMGAVKEIEGESARVDAEKDGKLEDFKKIGSSVGAEPNMLSDHIQRVLRTQSWFSLSPLVRATVGRKLPFAVRIIDDRNNSPPE